MDADHVAVEVLLDERAVGADAELAAEHDVERLRASAARFIAELQAGDLAALTRLPLVFVADELASTVSTYSYTTRTGALGLLGSIPATAATTAESAAGESGLE